MYIQQLHWITLYISLLYVSQTFSRVWKRGKLSKYRESVGLLNLVIIHVTLLDYFQSIIILLRTDTAIAFGSTVWSITCSGIQVQNQGLRWKDFHQALVYSSRLVIINTCSSRPIGIRISQHHLLKEVASNAWLIITYR